LALGASEEGVYVPERQNVVPDPCALIAAWISPPGGTLTPEQAVGVGTGVGLGVGVDVGIGVVVELGVGLGVTVWLGVAVGLGAGHVLVA
jgi:hypothetical protein